MATISASVAADGGSAGERSKHSASAARTRSNGAPVYSRWIASMLNCSATSSPTKASVSSAGVSSAPLRARTSSRKVRATP